MPRAASPSCEGGAPRDGGAPDEGGAPSKGSAPGERTRRQSKLNPDAKEWRPAAGRAAEGGGKWAGALAAVPPRPPPPPPPVKLPGGSSAAAAAQKPRRAAPRSFSVQLGGDDAESRTFCLMTEKCNGFPYWRRQTRRGEPELFMFSTKSGHWMMGSSTTEEPVMLRNSNTHEMMSAHTMSAHMMSARQHQGSMPDAVAWRTPGHTHVPLTIRELTIACPSPSRVPKATPKRRTAPASVADSDGKDSDGKDSDGPMGGAVTASPHPTSQGDEGRKGSDAGAEDGAVAPAAQPADDAGRDSDAAWESGVDVTTDTDGDDSDSSKKKKSSDDEEANEEEETDGKDDEVDVPGASLSHSEPTPLATPLQRTGRGWRPMIRPLVCAWMKVMVVVIAVTSLAAMAMGDGYDEYVCFAEQGICIIPRIMGAAP